MQGVESSAGPLRVFARQQSQALRIRKAASTAPEDHVVELENPDEEGSAAGWEVISRAHTIIVAVQISPHCIHL